MKKKQLEEQLSALKNEYSDIQEKGWFWGGGEY